MDLKAKDAKYFGRGLPVIPIEVVKQKGSYIYDKEGKRYIDFLMGWNVGNIGWGVEEVLSSIREFDGPEYVRPLYLYEPWVELAELLAKITPGNLVKSFPATGGTEAIEIALQAAMSYTKRTKFLSIEASYHGHSIGAMSIGSSSFRTHYTNLLPGCYKLKPPLDEKAAKEAEKLLSKGDIAALIMEPIVCNLAVEIPSTSFFSIVSKACKEYGTLLVIDEVATGFGRTGKLFAAEHYSLQPDIMILAKAITGGYGGLGAAIMTDEVAKAMDFPFSFYSTFGWHPISVAGALANLRYILKRKDALLKHVSETSSYFEAKLKKIKFVHLSKLRIKGLAIAADFSKEGYALELVKRSWTKGLLFTYEGESITWFPALTINKRVIDEAFEILEQCV